MRNGNNDQFYEDVSDHFESLFRSIPVQEMIDFILNRTFFSKKIKAFSKKSILKKVPLKITKECVFQLTIGPKSKFMVAQLALPSLYFFSGICVSKMKEKIFAEMKPQTCR